MIGKDVLPETDLLEKAVAIKRFEYYSLGKELEKQTSVVEKQYQNLTMVLSLIKQSKNKNQHLKNMLDEI